MINPILYRANRGFLGIIILIIYAAFPLHPVYATNSDSISTFSSSSFLQTDTMAPTIHNWSHSEIIADEYFIIWANVSDDDSGILNVSAVANVLSGNSTDSVFLLESNGSLYVTNEAILALNGTYRLIVESFDNAMNHRVSFGRTIDLLPTNPTDITKDPYLTMPYVIGTSAALFIVIIIVSFRYSKTREVSE